jgi:SAM-dependent methyltransferase
VGDIWEKVKGGRQGGIKVGVIGMGAGTIAAYAERGDEVLFFEIDEEIAREMPRHFSFIGDAQERGARVEVAVGDGRKLLERLPDQKFDILVVDAFSGDSVPAHLLSTEAFKEYSRHLTDGGILAVHASNRIIDVPSVARGGANSADLQPVTLVGKGEGLGVKSEWVAAAKSQAALEGLKTKADGGGGKEESVVWTDKFSDIASVLK